MGKETFDRARRVHVPEGSRGHFVALAHSVVESLNDGTTFDKISLDALMELRDAYVQRYSTKGPKGEVPKAAHIEDKAFVEWLAALDPNNLEARITQCLEDMYETTPSSDDPDLKDAAEDLSLTRFARLANRFGIRVKTFGNSRLHAKTRLGWKLDEAARSERTLRKELRRIEQANPGERLAEKLESEDLDDAFIGEEFDQDKSLAEQGAIPKSAPVLKLWFETDVHDHAVVRGFESTLGDHAILAHNHRIAQNIARKNHLDATLSGARSSTNTAPAAPKDLMGSIMKLFETLMPVIMKFIEGIFGGMRQAQANMQGSNPHNGFTTEELESEGTRLFAEHVDYVNDPNTKSRLIAQWRSAKTDEEQQMALDALKKNILTESGRGSKEDKQRAVQIVESLSFNFLIKHLSAEDKQKLHSLWVATPGDKAAIWKQVFDLLRDKKLHAPANELLTTSELQAENCRLFSINRDSSDEPELRAIDEDLKLDAEPMSEVHAQYKTALRAAQFEFSSKMSPEAQDENLSLRIDLMNAIGKVNADVAVDTAFRETRQAERAVKKSWQREMQAKRNLDEMKAVLAGKSAAERAKIEREQADAIKEIKDECEAAQREKNASKKAYAANKKYLHDTLSDKQKDLAEALRARLEAYEKKKAEFASRPPAPKTAAKPAAPKPAPKPKPKAKPAAAPSASGAAPHPAPGVASDSASGIDLGAGFASAAAAFSASASAGAAAFSAGAGPMVSPLLVGAAAPAAPHPHPSSASADLKYSSAAAATAARAAAARAYAHHSRPPLAYSSAGAAAAAGAGTPHGRRSGRFGGPSSSATGHFGASSRRSKFPPGAGPDDDDLDDLRGFRRTFT